MKQVKKWILPVLLFVLLSLLENSVGPIWSGCNPPYLLCFSIMCALFFDEKSACVFGVLAGLAEDVFSSDLFGLRAAVYLILVYLIAFLNATVLSRNVITGCVAGVAACLLAEVVVWGGVSLRTPVPVSHALRYVLLPRCVMALPVLLLLYGLFSRSVRDHDALTRRR